MSEYPYLWLTQTQEGEWHFIPMNEAQLQLLSSLGLDLIEVKIPSPFHAPMDVTKELYCPRQSYWRLSTFPVPTESPKQACYFRLPSEVTFYTHRECSLGSQWYEPTWDEFRLVSIETVPQEAQCHVCHGFVQQAPRQTPTESPNRYPNVPSAERE